MTGLVFLQPKGLSRIFFRTTIWKHQLLGTQPSLWSNSHICTGLLEKSKLWPYRTLLAKWCFCFLRLSRFVMTFLPRSKCFSVLWLQSPSTIILEPKKIKSVTAYTFSHVYLAWSDGPGWHDLSVLMYCFKPEFSLSSFTLIKRIFSFSLISAIRVISAASQVVDIWPNNLDSSLSFINYAILHDVLFI